MEEQELLLKHLLKTSREVAKVMAAEEVKSRDDVTDVMKDKWKRQREREKELEGTHHVHVCETPYILIIPYGH